MVTKIPVSSACLPGLSGVMRERSEPVRRVGTLLAFDEGWYFCAGLGSRREMLSWLIFVRLIPLSRCIRRHNEIFKKSDLLY